ncbi:MAG: hypothetical protein ABI461_19045, partial [Polyangiaceae bacterium]
GVDSYAQLTIAPPSIFWSAVGVLGTAGATKNGGVWQCALTGCGDTPTQLSKTENVNGAVTDGASIYYAATSTTVSGVFTCPLAGCGTTPTQVMGGATGAFQLAHDSDAIYWTALDGVHRFVKSSSITSPIITTDKAPFAIVVDTNSVYYTSIVGDYVQSCPLSGCSGPPRVYASALTQPSFLAQDAAALYFSSGSVSSGTISRVSK